MHRSVVCPLSSHIETLLYQSQNATPTFDIVDFEPPMVMLMLQFMYERHDVLWPHSSSHPKGKKTASIMGTRYMETADVTIVEVYLKKRASQRTAGNIRRSGRSKGTAREVKDSKAADPMGPPGRWRRRSFRWDRP
jgi:hypothetical protein